MQFYRVFIKYCVFSKILKYIPDSGLSRFSLGISVCVYTMAGQRRWDCSRTCRVQKNHKILRKSTIFNEPLGRLVTLSNFVFKLFQLLLQYTNYTHSSFQWQLVKLYLQTMWYWIFKSTGCSKNVFFFLQFAMVCDLSSESCQPPVANCTITVHLRWLQGPGWGVNRLWKNIILLEHPVYGINHICRVAQ